MHDSDDRWQEFEVKGARFRLRPLKVKDAEDLAQPLVELLTPAAAALIAEGKSFNEVSQAIVGVGRAAKQLPIFREKFMRACKWCAPNESSKELWVPLDTRYDEVFERNHARYYAWLRECITLEFGDFLAEIGQGAMTKLEAKLSSFLSGFDGASTESQPAADTTTPTEK
jgi:hypothetical protein